MRVDGLEPAGPRGAERIWLARRDLGELRYRLQVTRISRWKVLVQRQSHPRCPVPVSDRSHQNRMRNGTKRNQQWPPTACTTGRRRDPRYQEQLARARARRPTCRGNQGRGVAAHDEDRSPPTLPLRSRSSRHRQEPSGRSGTCPSGYRSGACRPRQSRRERVPVLIRSAQTVPTASSQYADYRVKPAVSIRRRHRAQTQTQCASTSGGRALATRFLSSSLDRPPGRVCTIAFIVVPRAARTVSTTYREARDEHILAVTEQAPTRAALPARLVESLAEQKPAADATT
jgi:hypothetical protein